MLNFPQWSDLGKTSQISRGMWEEMQARIEEYRGYYNGNIFDTRVELDEPTADAPLMYPAGMNIVKMIIQAQADALFGEYEDDIITFEPAGEETADSSLSEALKLLQNIARNSNLNAKLWEAALDRELYGGAAFKVTPNLKRYDPIRWNKVPLDSFYPVWDPEDEDNLLEVNVVLEMTREQARARYGYDGNKEIVMRIEHWDQRRYTNLLDGHEISGYSGVNPWGFVPFIYMPRIRTDNWWGDALTPDLIAPQNEVNARIADIGEAINYNAHPTRWGINLPRSFKVDNFPLGPNAFWDLGRSIGSMPEPKVGVVEIKNPVPAEVFTFVNFLYDWTRTSSFLPPIAFGQDNGGGQRSGDTLEIRMWSMVKAIHRSRAYMTAGLRRLIWMSAQILKQKRLLDIPSRAITRLEDGLIVPRYGSVLPRDHQSTVDEVVKLMTTTPPTISIETAQKILGRGPGEVEKIKAMLNMTELYKNAMTEAQMEMKTKAAGENQPQPGKKKEDANGKVQKAD
jgi:hypothetical protein